MLITPRWILKMRVEKGELLWTDIKFELKSQSSQGFDLLKVLAFPRLSNKLNKVGEEGSDLHEAVLTNIETS